MRALLVVLALAACGDDDGGSAPIDAPDDGASGDAPPQEPVRWRLTDRPATSIVRFDDELPILAGRSTRVSVQHPRRTCDLLAMPDVAIDAQAHTVTITPRVFVSIPDERCPDASIARHVTLALGEGTWTVAGGTAPPLTLTVGPAPDRACGLSPCSLDCDCDTAAGERCLGAVGLGGPFLGCARPCELDRDCGGTGACVDRDDGHFLACDPQPECTATFPCPSGFACSAAGACEPTFTLTAGTRHECSTDQDCDPGLRCVEATVAGGGAHRCEALCKSGGAWCQGAHVCGDAEDDLGNLARTDSVCGFLGD